MANVSDDSAFFALLTGADGEVRAQIPHFTVGYDTKILPQGVSAVGTRAVTATETACAPSSESTIYFLTSRLFGLASDLSETDRRPVWPRVTGLLLIGSARYIRAEQSTFQVPRQG